MNTSSWRHYYEQNRLNREEPNWAAPCLIPDDIRRKLAVSLSHFQLGETGGGTFLLKEAAGQSNTDDLASLSYFVAEEKEHARLLSCMVRRLDGKLVHRHWTHRLFKLARRAGGFRFEIQMLLTAEIVGTAYYEMVQAGTSDSALSSAVALMLRDESKHVAFHQDRLSHHWRDYFPLERATWALQFQILVLAAVRAAWLDHGTCLRSLGFTWVEFAQRTRQLSTQFIDGLHAPQTSCGACSQGKLTVEIAQG